jgi:anti-sigma factor RsiW
MTTDRRATWSTLDLELFRDGELAEDLRAALSEALRSDPRLRDRLAGIARVDAAASAAFAAPAPIARPARRPFLRMAVFPEMIPSTVVRASSASHWLIVVSAEPGAG